MPHAQHPRASRGGRGRAAIRATLARPRSFLGRLVVVFTGRTGQSEGSFHMEASSSGAGAAGGRQGAGRTLAQTFCLVVGIVLIAVGVLGFFFGGTSFAVGDAISGENFIVFA